MKVEYIDHMGSDLSVVNAARCSFAKQHDEFDDTKDTKLINYLAKHGHFTPFTHAFVTMRFKAPIAVHAQCGKHQIGFSMNTVSRRYVSDTPELFLPEFRTKPEGSIKQGSGALHTDNLNIQYDYFQMCTSAIELYEQMILDGVAPEQARFVLPQGVYTEWVWSGSLQAWARFYSQRSDTHAQQEIQELANMANDITKNLFPVSWEALTKDTK